MKAAGIIGFFRINGHPASCIRARFLLIGEC